MVVRYLVTLAEATKIVRFFNKKQHRDAGYFFDMEDLGATMSVAMKLPALASDTYRAEVPLNSSAAWFRENAYVLRVYRDTQSR